MKITTLVGRILYSLLFLSAAPGHFSAATIGYAAAQGVPLANLAVPASGILALLGGLSVALGYKTKLGALALIAFLVPVTVMMHNFWAVSDPMMHQLPMVMFMKNIAHADDNADNHVANLLEVADGDNLDHHVDAPTQGIEIGVATGYTRGVGSIGDGMQRIEDISRSGASVELDAMYRINARFAVGVYFSLARYATVEQIGVLGAGAGF